MALRKQVTLPGGMITKYHRIGSLKVIPGGGNIIELLHYPSESKRDQEKKAYETAAETGQFPEMNVAIEAESIELPYAEAVSMESAYEYIKTLPKYKNAKDA